MPITRERLEEILLGSRFTTSVAEPLDMGAMIILHMLVPGKKFSISCVDSNPGILYFDYEIEEVCAAADEEDIFALRDCGVFIHYDAFAMSVEVNET